MAEPSKDIPEASKRARVSYFWFTVFGFYLALVAGATTHEQLIRGTAMTMPTLQVDLPIKGFYVIVPPILVLLHAQLLFYLKALADKIAAEGKGMEVAGSLLTTAIPYIPKDSLEEDSPGVHRWSTIIIILMIGLKVQYFFSDRVGTEPKDVLSDSVMTIVGGVFELLATIVYTIEDYDADIVTPNEQAKMAVSYLSAFPDLCILGAILQEPDTAAVLFLIGTASYLGAAVASGFVDLEGESG